MANQPVPMYGRKSFQDFSGGINNYESVLRIKQNQFEELTDALVNKSGLLERAKGYILDGAPGTSATTSLCRMLVNYQRGSTVDKLVVANHDATNANTTYKVDLKETSGDGNYAYIYHVSGSSCAFTNGNTAVVGIGTAWSSQLKAGDKIKSFGHTDAMYTEIETVTNDTNLVLVAGGYLGATVTVASASSYKARIILHKDFIPSATVFNNNLIVTNGSEAPMSYNNTALSKITDADAPKGKFIAAHKSRVFIASTSGAPSSIFWSAVNDETAWDATSVEPVFANDNGNICNIKSFADSLIVLKDNGKMYQVVGEFDQDAVGEPNFIRKIDTPDNIGPIFGFTPVVHDDNKLYFLAETGVYSLDTRMYIEKQSWPIQDTVDQLALKSTATSTKSVLYDTATQWNTGTYADTRVNGNSIESIFDTLVKTDSNQTLIGQFSCDTDSSNNVYIAYIDSANAYTIKFAVYDSTGALTSSETAVVDTDNPIQNLCIKKAANGDVGIVYVTALGGSPRNAYYLKRASGGTTWTAREVITSEGANLVVQQTIALQFASDSTARVVIPWSAAGRGASYYSRGSGSWAFRGDILDGVDTVICKFRLTSDQPRLVLQLSLTGTTDNIRSYSSANNGSTWSTIENFTTASGDVLIDMAILNGGDVVSCFISNNAIKKRNHTTPATTTLVSGTGTTRQVLGYSSYYSTISGSAADRDYLYYVEGSAGSQVEKFYFESATTITSAVTNYMSLSAYQVHGGNTENNGATFAFFGMGASANNLVVRRLAFRSTWTAPEASDATLTAWGTYEVTDQVDNGATVTHAVALASSSPATSFTTITDGTVISSDATLIYNIARVTFVLGGFAAPTLGGIELNYTGTGVDGKIPCGVLFDNEYYLAVANSGSANNDLVILHDNNKAFTTMTPDVTFMARYKKRLYAGSATNGNVYRLNQTYAQAGVAYTTTAISKEDLLGSLELDKEIYKIYVLYQIQDSGTFTFQYRTNNFMTSGGSTWYSTTVDQTVEGIADIPVVTGLLKSVQFKMTAANTGANTAIIGYVVLYGYANVR